MYFIFIIEKTKLTLSYIFRILMVQNSVLSIPFLFYSEWDASTMGKLRSFYVELLDPQQVYFAGQTINGRLVVELDAEMKMRGFKQ